VHDDLINHINSRRTTWTAGHNAKFEGMTIGQAKGLMGARLGGPLPPVFDGELDVEVPDNFDARINWPQCPSITLVRDQSACGSCWAFGSTEAFNDRYCISSKNTTILAAADVLSCCGWTCGDGCDGGYPQQAWEYFKNHGAVADECDAYPFPACAHHVVSPDYPACPSADYSTPKCPKTCTDGSSFASTKVRASKVYSISGEENVMKQLVANGPVTAAFTVYADFLTYQSGVYQHVSGDELGGHAIEIVGYGSDNGVKYWIVKNSWNPSWGNGGFFNILRGQNECGIEGEIVAGDA
jgi:cathepsin B